MDSMLFPVDLVTLLFTCNIFNSLGNKLLMIGQCFHIMTAFFVRDLIW